MWNPGKDFVIKSLKSILKNRKNKKFSKKKRIQLGYLDKRVVGNLLFRGMSCGFTHEVVQVDGREGVRVLVTCCFPLDFLHAVVDERGHWAARQNSIQGVELTCCYRIDRFFPRK